MISHLLFTANFHSFFLLLYIMCVSCSYFLQYFFFMGISTSEQPQIKYFSFHGSLIVVVNYLPSQFPLPKVSKLHM